MAKNSIRDYSATAGSNTDIQSINIDEGCAASNLNNAVRELMADLKNVSTGAIALESPQADSISIGDGHQIGDETTYDNLVIKSSTDESLVSSAGGTGQFLWKTGSTTLDNGSEKMRLTNDGKLGLGTTSPSGTLEVAASEPTIRLKDSDNNYYAELRNNNGNFELRADHSSGFAGSVMTFTVDNSEKMRITDGGNVGIGTNSPSARLHLKTPAGDNCDLFIEDSTFSPNIRMYSGGTNINSSIFYGAGAGSSNLIFRQITAGAGITGANTERMRIDNSGNLLVGTTSAGSAHGIKTVYSSGTVDTNVSEITSTSGTGFHWSFRRGSSEVGTITSTSSSTSYNTSSDYRLKENVTKVTGAADRVKALNPVRFNFIADPDKTVDGFLAHEVADVVPEAIKGTKDAMRDEEYEVTPAVEATYDDEGNVLTEAVPAVMGTRSVPDYQGIDQSKLVPLLTAALQEALTKIDDLESRLSALETA